MNKIRLNELEFFNFFNGIKDTNIEIVAFYGDFIKCMELAERYTEKRVTSPIILDEGLVAIQNNNKIALIYKTNHAIYDLNSEVNSDNLAVTYLRYLLDTCHDIYAVQPASQTFNAKSENPY
jgi:hypothetical protein